MTTGTVISQLESLAKKLEAVLHTLQTTKIQPSKAQYRTFDSLGLRLSDAVGGVSKQVEITKQRRARPVSEEGAKLISQAQSDVKDVIVTKNLKKRGMFGRNIFLFFDGPKELIIDSSTIKARKKLTRDRCERIRDLGPNGVIYWALAFTPTLWTANSMSKGTFDYVLEHIEPDAAPSWPSDIFDTLHALGGDAPLLGSEKYQEFLKAVQDIKQDDANPEQSRKRQRLNSSTPETAHLQELQPTLSEVQNSQGPSPQTQSLRLVQVNQPSTGSAQEIETETQQLQKLQTGRQLQYVFSKAPIDQVFSLGKPLSDAVQASQQWQMERRRGENTTDCLAFMMPEDPTQDISITLWIGQEMGVDMRDTLNLQPTWSSLQGHLSL